MGRGHVRNMLLLCLLLAIAPAVGAMATAWPRWHAFDAADGLPSSEVQALAQDRAGVLWIGTRAGLARHDGVRIEAWRAGPGGGAALPGHDVRALSALADGRLWIVFGDGRAGWLSADRQRFVASSRPPVAPGPRPQPRLRSRDGTLWVGGPDGLRSRAPGQAWRDWSGHPQPPRAVSALLEDHEGGLWIGSRGGGLLRLAPRAAAFGTRAPPVSPGCPWRPTGLATAGPSALWVASDTCLFRVELARPGALRLPLPPGLSPQPLHGLAAGPDGSAWALADDAVLAWTPDGRWRGRWPLPAPRQVLPLAGAVWVLDGEGVPREWQGRHWRPRPAGAPVLRLFAGPDDEAWAAVPGGLRRWRDGRWQAVEGAPGAPVELAVRGHRLWWLDAAGLREVRWHEGRLSPGPAVADVAGHAREARLGLDGEGWPWLASPMGLSLPEPGEFGGWRHFGARDGLGEQALVGSVAWLPGPARAAVLSAAGIELFDPVRLRAPLPAEAPLDLSLQAVRGEALVELAAAPGLARLAHGDRDLRLSLRRVSFSGPGGDRFAAWIEGLDPGPVELGPAGVRLLPSLSPGLHRLHVASAGPDGRWSSPRLLTLLVDPPWWRTRELALLLTGLVLAAMVALAAGLRRHWRGRQSLRRLHARRREAERVSEAKTRFLATLSHEIRTPMTGVLGMAELLQAGELAPVQRGRVDALQAAGRHLVRLVNDALDLARIEAGRLRLEEAPFDLGALLAEVAALLRPLAAARGLGFALAPADGLAPGRRGDATRVRQILINLGHNAIKFCDQGGLTLSARAAAGGVDIGVRDTGPGMPAAQRERLFHRFEAGPSAGGAGLGLAISQELAAAMGGRIAVDSAPGRGTCFRVWLPLPEAEVAPPPEPAPGPAGARRVLLVEDDALVADVVTGLLEAAGHAVTHAPHALAALSAHAAGDHDLLLLDLDLPGMDGLELSQLLQARGDAVPRVAITARADPEAEPAARAAGMVGFLRKPVSGEALAGAVARWARAPAAEAQRAE